VLTERLTEAQVRGRLVVLEARTSGHRAAAELLTSEEEFRLHAARRTIPWRHFSCISDSRITLAAIDAHLHAYRPTLLALDLRVPARREDAELWVVRLAALALHHGCALVLKTTLARGLEAPARAELGAAANGAEDVLLLHRDFVAEDAEDDASALWVHCQRRSLRPQALRLSFDHRFAGVFELPGSAGL
jgi:hypothetical protein